MTNKCEICECLLEHGECPNCKLKAEFPLEARVTNKGDKKIYDQPSKYGRIVVCSCMLHPIYTVWVKWSNGDMVGYHHSYLWRVEDE